LIQIPKHSRLLDSPRRSLILAAALAAPFVAAMGVAPSSAWAQTYPDRPVRLVVATAAGGAMDLTARHLADHLSSKLGQPVIVDNRPGAGSLLAGHLVAKSPPDGYTLLFVSAGYSTLPALYPKMPFSLADLAPVAVVVSVPYVFVTPPNAPYNTLAGFIASAKAHPGQLNFASGGNATGGHLAGIWFKSETKLDIQHIPFKGEAPAVQAMLGNQVSMMPVTLTVGLPLLKSGKLQALAISSARRSPLLPDVPTLTELGVPVQSVVWFGMLAPAGVPQGIRDRLNQVVNQALLEPELREKYVSIGMSVEGGSQTEFQRLIEREAVHWSRLIKESDIKAE
jgi:tripartite-type tricarboxylate transporter receptor subunit TctC